MSGPARNQPCSCGSGIKYKKCCGRSEPRGPAVDLRLPRGKAGFDWLAARPRSGDLGSSGRVWLEGANRRPELVFGFSFDAELNAAIKRLPGRRFDYGRRIWTIPADPRICQIIWQVLDEHPWLEVADEVYGWLEGNAPGWSGCLSALALDDEPMILLHHHDGVVPEEISERALVFRGDVLLLTCDRENAALLRDRSELAPDAIAEAVLAAASTGRRPAGATLTLGHDEDRQPRFELRTDWLLSVADEFLRLPEATVVGERDEACLFDTQRAVLAMPADPALAGALREWLARARDIQVDRSAAALLERLEAECARAEATVALSRADEVPLPTDGFAGELRPFQRAAVKYALAQRRTFLADEQGLGKTIEALAALHLDGAFPVAVICPASMKLVWRQECERWLPGRTIAVLDGRGAAGWARAGADRADVVICNYDILEAHGPRLQARDLRGVVFDESHYCKDARRNRTKAAIKLSQSVPDGGLRLALTGTPIMNRPRELVSQLRLIDRLSEFGSGAHLARRFRGPGALERLHWHLRAHCYVRRTKSQVLRQLPDKRLTTVPLDIDNRGEYRMAEGT